MLFAQPILKIVALLFATLNLSACQEILVGSAAAAYYYSTVPEHAEPPQSVFVKPAHTQIEAVPVLDQYAPQKSVANAYRGAPSHYRPVEQDTAMHKEDEQKKRPGPRWFHLMMDDIKSLWR